MSYRARWSSFGIGLVAALPSLVNSGLGAEPAVVKPPVVVEYGVYAPAPPNPLQPQAIPEAKFPPKKWQPTTTIEVIPPPGVLNEQDQDGVGVPSSGESNRDVKGAGAGARAGASARESRPAVLFAFDGPAFFPLPKYGAGDCERYEAEGATIVEGMSVKVFPDGTFRTSFLVQAPAMPLTLRLQLVARDEKGLLGTMTLPPISLQPMPTTDNEPEADTFRVTHEGYSPFLAMRLVPTAPNPILKNLGGEPSLNVTFERRGVARFGSGVPPSVIGLR